MFTGLLLKESLHDESILNELQISKTEIWDVENTAEFQPEKWTAIFFNGDKILINEIAEKLSKSIKYGWYANMSDENYKYVIFTEKVFKCVKGQKLEIDKITEYGLAIGIPEHQTDWWK